MSRLKFSTSIIEIIQRRFSCRTYNTEPLDDKTKNNLIEFLQADHTNPFDGETRFELLEIPELDPKVKTQLGTYGFIQGAQTFIVGAISKKSEYDLENFGYIMEELILLATDLGLGTCWVGGTLKRSKFAAQINITDDEIVPAITPVGYASQSRSKVDRLACWAARSHRRHPWDNLFFEGDCKHPLTRERAGRYDLPLEMIRLAPSASNRQPWRVIKDSKNFHFFILRKRSWYSRLLSLPDFPRIDLGIAVCHFNLTAQEQGLRGSWQFIQPEIIIPAHLRYLISWISE
ncbi:MAG: nitroreductase family protein [Candidatus Heimdallarchaeota archaeon]|nr:MAG: nitroreductase family protein [Candidatus Heimdallarchaeota archaeon]